MKLLPISGTPSRGAKNPSRFVKGFCYFEASLLVCSTIYFSHRARFTLVPPLHGNLYGLLWHFTFK